MALKWRIVVIALLQTCALAAILADRATILASQREIVLATEPVDPRDLFRGDFVTLNYTASQIDVATVGGDNVFDKGQDAYVVFAESDHLWQPVAIYRHRLASKARASGEVMVKARVINSYLTDPDHPEKPCPEGCETEVLSYGVESYFVPEGSGAELEDARNDAGLEIVIAVRSDGRAAIKALQLDGRVLSQEGIF